MNSPAPKTPHWYHINRILVSPHPRPFAERPAYGFTIAFKGKGRKALRRALKREPLQNEIWNPRVLPLGLNSRPSHKLPKPRLP